MEVLIKEYRFSLYQLEIFKRKIFLGGSEWNRRKIPYSKEVTKNSNGILEIDNTLLIKFPNEIYSLTKLEKNKLFIGLSYGKNSYNILNLDSMEILTKSDFDTNGVIDSDWDRRKKEIVIGGRNGKIVILDSELIHRDILSLYNNDTKIRSVRFDGNFIYAGDYVGNFWIIDRKSMEILKRIDVNVYGVDRKSKKEKMLKGFKDNIFGLDYDKENIYIGTRWGKLIIVSKKNFEVQNVYFLDYNVSFLRVYKNSIFLGTRQGYLLKAKKGQFDFEVLYFIPPKIQKENSIWDIDIYGKNIYCTWADGYFGRIKI